MSVGMLCRYPPPLWSITTFCLLLAAVTNTYGGCEFPDQWSGRWFQSGVGILQVNKTNIETKGECYDSQGDKFVIYDKTDDCYRCMAIHEKHKSVLQYKETYCDQKASLAELCYSITGDAALYSMFRKSPEDRAVPCPFKAAPFTFTYNRGSGECSNPPSKAESCTDDSRLVLKYQACPDIQSTESNVEELVCLATWKEGSTRYLIGRISQVNRRNALVSDEDQYRCFIYERMNHHGGRVTYHIAQSGDATCNGLQNALEGSRTIRLTTVDNHHSRCRFPAWITDHHTWLSLDHRKTYKFSLRNATLRITQDENMSENDNSDRFGVVYPNEEIQKSVINSEVRVVCHSILSQSNEQKRVQIVAHITAGCDSGYVCMMFYKRDGNVIEIQQSDSIQENTDDACRYFDPSTTPYTTLITPSLHPVKCPHSGRYTAVVGQGAERRRRRQQVSSPVGVEGAGDTPPDCLSHHYEALAVGCTGSPDVMEFRSACTHQPLSAYSCHGSWQENNTHYLIASPVARKSTDALRYCLVYTFEGLGELSSVGPGLGPGGVASTPGAWSHHSLMRLSGLGDSCHRNIVAGRSGLWAFNFTTNGTCAEANDTSDSVCLAASLPILVSVMAALLSVMQILNR